MGRLLGQFGSPAVVMAVAVPPPKSGMESSSDSLFHHLLGHGDVFSDQNVLFKASLSLRSTRGGTSFRESSNSSAFLLWSLWCVRAHSPTLAEYI